ncbi:MAG TPA: DUF2254 domain-containing protein [Thermoanaerobaculia bacterium]|nr:DUF2254 domain-containing protein [Thermoanaerobaculia bacterium]
MRTRTLRFWDSLRSSYWFVPAGMMLAAVGLALVTTRLDEALHRPGSSTQWLGRIWPGGVEGAREVLSIIAATAINVAGVTFSITIVALTLASSQFGPRMLRNFMRDTGNQVVLGTFVATHVYCLLALRTVQSAEDRHFVPHVSLLTGLVLGLVSLCVLIYFIHHVASSIRAENLIANVAEDLHQAIGEIFPDEVGEPAPREVRQLPPGEPAPVRVVGRGYIQALDHEALLAMATEEDLVVRLDRRPGDFVSEGDVLAQVWPAERCGDAIRDRMAKACLLGRHRTQIQDVEYSLHQLVEIAVRAQSAAYNDPFTTMSCLDWLGSVLSRLARCELPSAWRSDSAGRLRVIASSTLYADMADTAFNQIRQHSRRSVSVILRLLTVIGRVAAHVVRPGDREALRRHADLVLQDAREELTNQNDLREVELRYLETLQILETGERGGGAGSLPERRESQGEAAPFQGDRRSLPGGARSPMGRGLSLEGSVKK